MTTGALIIVALRIIIPLLILRWALVGGIAAILIDMFDVVLIEVIGLGGFGSHYHSLDKLLDSYYLAIEFSVAWGWTNPWARWPALVMFPYRMLGVLLFEITDRRIFLFVFPNIFENWWIYCLAVARMAPQWTPRSIGTVVVPFLVLLAPKMGQEYLLHYTEAQPWDWTKEHILGGKL